jgi:hypothetical protein
VKNRYFPLVREVSEYRGSESHQIDVFLTAGGAKKFQFVSACAEGIWLNIGF